LLRIAQEWFRYAKQDLDSATYLQEMQPVPVEEECLNLTDYGVQARYPFNLELNEMDAHSSD
jgi:hypothetical protein